jgi:hypothetical protein
VSLGVAGPLRRRHRLSGRRETLDNPEPPVTPKEFTMATNLSPGEGMLPVTGFGPGSLIVAVIGGALTLCGAIMRRISRRPAAG